MESRTKASGAVSNLPSKPQIRIYYNVRNKQKKSRFVHFFAAHKDMMRTAFLQFLESFEVYRLAITCKEIRTIVDPEECGGQFKKSNHLKLIAMIQCLKSDEKRMHEADQVFGIDISRVQHYSYLNGQVYKDELFRIMAQPPGFDRYGASDLRQIWLNELYGNVITSFPERKNPLPTAMRKMKIEYDHRRLFTLRFISNLEVIASIAGFHREQDSFIDFDILIEGKLSQSQLNKLEKHLESNQKIDLDHDVMQALNGIGRIIHYESMNHYEPTYCSLKTIYEGQIKHGLPHGFGRVINGNRFPVLFGHFHSGKLYGKFVSLTSLRLRVGSQGVFDDRKEHCCLEQTEVTDFEELITDERMEELSRQLHRNMVGVFENLGYGNKNWSIIGTSTGGPGS